MRMTLGISDRPAPWTVIGYRADGRPIHLLAGGAPDDDDADDGIEISADDAEDDEPDEVEDDDADVEDDKPKPKAAAKAPTDADLKRVTGALEKERLAAKDARAKLRESQAEVRALKKAAEPKSGDDEVVVKAVEAARAEAEARFKPIVVTKAARAALLEAGLAPETSAVKVKKMLRLLDLDDIDVDEDGEVSGLEDQIDQIKNDFPELFRKPEPEPTAPKVRAPKVDAANRPNTQPAPKTTGEIHAAHILNRN